MDNDRHKIWHSDRSPLEEQFCVFKIFKVSAIFKMAAKTQHKKWAVKIQHCPMFRIVSRNWKMSTVRHFQNGRHNTAQIQHCPISSKFDMWVDNDVPNRIPTLIMMSQIYSRHSKISNGHHFQNGHHNTAQIQHYPISTTFHMWVDYDIPNRFPTLKNHILLLLLLLLLLFSLFSFSFLSLAHELVHSSSQELLDRVSWNLVEL